MSGLFFVFFGFGDGGGGGGGARAWRGHSSPRRRRRKEWGLSVLGDRWRGGLVYDGLVLDGLHVAVVGNWGPGWNVGGTLIRNTTGVHFPRPSVPAIAAMASVPEHTHTHTDIYTQENIHMRSHTHTYVRCCPPPSPLLLLLISSVGFRYSTPPALPPEIPPPCLTKLAPRL